MSSIPNPPRYETESVNSLHVLVIVLINFSLVEYKKYKFLIFDAPTDQNLDLYIHVRMLHEFFSLFFTLLR